MRTILFLLAVVIFISCTDTASPRDSNSTKKGTNQVSGELDQQAVIESPATLYFSGKIGEYPIFMSISNDEDIEGQYRYAGSSSFMNLKGTKNKDGQLSISEFNSKGVVTGMFEGKVDDKGTFTGFWENQLKDKPKLYFELTSIDPNTYDSQNKPKTIEKSDSGNSQNSDFDGESFAGEYKYWIGGEDAPTGSITWTFTFSGADFIFEGVGTEECGELKAKGSGRLISTNGGEGVGNFVEKYDFFEDENNATGTCGYVFEFTDESVKIHEKNCEGDSPQCPRVYLTGKIPKVPLQ
jgi:hypothetical protein